jgi:hypothetical protein
MSAASSNYLKVEREHRAKDTSSLKSPLCDPVHPVVTAFRVRPAHTSGFFQEFCNVMHVVRGLASATLREIFDEAAYERFLAHHQQTATVETYAAFCRENEDRKQRRPRCC